MNPLIEQIKSQYRSGSMVIKLLIINVGFFVLIQFIDALQRLQIDPSTPKPVDHRWIDWLFALPGSFEGLLFQPWTIVLSLFAHFGIWHLLTNIIFLYFAGNTYEKFFGPRRLLHLYLLGGIAGNLSEIIAHIIFPAIQNQMFSVVGASGSIMAIFIALAFSKPQLQFQLFGILPLRIYYIAIFFLLKDLSSVGTADNIAHFAHIGGGAFGIWSIQQFWSSQMDKKWLGFRGKKTKFKVKKGGRPLSDDQYRENKQTKQAQLDRILDKISKKGYDGLTKEEKDFLFQQSKDV